MLVGLFEPVGAPWSLDGVPREFAFGKLPPDWERMEPYLAKAMDRIPSLAETGVRTFFCGPESFTSDVRPLLGPAPELDGYFVAAGLNSLGILSGGGVGHMVAHWIVDGVPPLDVTAVAIDRTATYETSRKFRAQRTVEQLGVLFGDAVWPSWKPSLRADVRRSVLHDRLAAAGAHFGVSAGWEYPEWFASQASIRQATMDFRRQRQPRIVGREHQRDPRGRRRDRHVLDGQADRAGPGRGRGAEPAVGERRRARDRPPRLHPMAEHRGRHRRRPHRDPPWRREVPDRGQRHHPPQGRAADQAGNQAGEFVTVTDVTSGTTLLTVQGPASRELISRLTDADLSNQAFPYLSARAGACRLRAVLAMRVTYVGELGWELHVPAEYGAGVYDDLMSAGADLGIRPVGLAAMSSLRLEKGYRDMGVDIDNTDNPIEAGLGFAVAWDKPGGFIGRDALLAARAEGPPKHRVVGLMVADPSADLFGNEPVFLAGERVGYVRAAAFRLHGRRPCRAGPGCLRGRCDL